MPFFYTQLQEIYPEENWLQNRLCYFELGYRSETTMGPIAISESQKHQWCLRGVYIWTRSDTNITQFKANAGWNCGSRIRRKRPSWHSTKDDSHPSWEKRFYFWLFGDTTGISIYETIFLPGIYSGAQHCGSRVSMLCDCRTFLKIAKARCFLCWVRAGVRSLKIELEIKDWRIASLLS